MGVRFGVSWGRGPYTSTPPPHIHGPHCARRPTVRDGWPTRLIPSFTFTSPSDPVVILWCPSQPGADGMRRGGWAGPQDHALPQSRPPGGAKIPASAHPCRVLTTRSWGCFREGSHQGAYPPVPPLVRPQGSPGGGVGNSTPAPHGVSQRAPPSSAHDPLAPALLPRLRGAFNGPSAALGPHRLWLSPACCRRPGPRCGSPARPPGAPPSWPQHRGCRRPRLRVIRRSKPIASVSMTHTIPVAPERFLTREALAQAAGDPAVRPAQLQVLVVLATRLDSGEWVPVPAASVAAQLGVERGVGGSCSAAVVPLLLAGGRAQARAGDHLPVRPEGASGVPDGGADPHGPAGGPGTGAGAGHRTPPACQPCSARA